jgi:hypothetical protein
MSVFMSTSLRARITIAMSLATLLWSCSPENLVNNAPLPPDVPDPTQTQTPAGAIASYRGALLQLRSAFAGNPDSYVPVSGLLTDELRSGRMGEPGSIFGSELVDSRFLLEDPGIGEDSTTAFPVRTLYGLLQRVRGQARQARGALHAYAPDAPIALTGHLYAVEAYGEVLLADLYCSGIPLSTLDFGGDFTYQPGSSTADVYRHAITYFDSALAIASDTARIMNLATVGKGRALLALAEYDAAATAVANVPDDFRYELTFDPSSSGGSTGTNLLSNRNYVWNDFANQDITEPVTMVDREGDHGLPYMSSGDPRSAWMANGSTVYGLELFSPTRYALDGTTPIVLASGVEARLIQAEAALKAGNASWLVTLNALRTDGSFDTQPDTLNPANTDTLWHAGKGGVAGLKPLEDPVDPDARVTMLFDERGYWLFLTGHRQGDLRRLIRQYGRQSQLVYPSGPYRGAFNSYGGAVTAPIPGAERVSNPLFTGCQGRGA